MTRNLGRNFALLVAGTCLVLACAADRGDPLKTSSAVSGSGSPGGGDSDAGLGSGSGSSDGSSGDASSDGSSGASSDSGDSGSSSDSGSANDGEGGVDAGGIVPQGGASCITSSCPLMLQFRPLQASPSVPAISPSFHISTTMPGTVDLANIKIHYYYTADSNPPASFACDAAHYLNSPASIPTSAVQGKFVPMGASATPVADTYLEVSFPSAMLPYGSTVEINARFFSLPNYPMYNQTNDWSFLSYPTGSGAYVVATNTTAYLNGVLAWGVEPGGTGSDAGVPTDASPRDAGDGG